MDDLGIVQMRDGETHVRMLSQAVMIMDVFGRICRWFE